MTTVPYDLLPDSPHPGGAKVKQHATSFPASQSVQYTITNNFKTVSADSSNSSMLFGRVL